MKIVYSDKKTGKTSQAEVAKDKEAMLLGKKMGEIIDGFPAGLDGFKLQITGLSDKMGSPSRREIDGTRKAKPLLGSGVGIRGAKGGFRRRKLVRGNAISVETEQINTIIVEYGSKPAEEIFKAKVKAEEK